MSHPTDEVHHIVGLCGYHHEMMKRIGDFLGTRGADSDVVFYTRHEQRDIWAVAHPTGYPDKIKSLVQTLRLSNLHILCLPAGEPLGPLAGEAIVAMDLFKRLRNTHVFACIGDITPKTEYNVEPLQDTLRKVTKGSAIEGIPIFTVRAKDDLDTLKAALLKAPPLPPPQNFTKVLVDNSFPVKGVGTVILGVVESGQVVASEMLELMPDQKKVIVRSIQKQDRDFKTAEAGDHVGLAIKGIKPEEISRDNVLATVGMMEPSENFEAKCSLSPYSKITLSAEDKTQYHLIVDLAVTPVKITGGDTIAPGGHGNMQFKVDKKISLNKGKSFGILLYLEKFTGKLRIIGSLEMTS
ncbi:MAG: Selenocysteine-specific translation elongation factor [Promethearchaeota archaeon CR_4]|nr:MAG: Selenocysteine-specific translation elongation factor [Candidatus Lokiarchaeota archaeon CR_4]